MKTHLDNAGFVYSVDDNTISVVIDNVEIALADVEDIRWMIELWDLHNR